MAFSFLSRGWAGRIGGGLVSLLASASVAGAGSLATPPLVSCTGNCDGGPAVTVEELIRGVNIALNQLPVGLCARFDRNGDGRVSVDELVEAVNNALRGCGVTLPSRTPTPSPSSTPVPPETPTPSPFASPTATQTATRTATRTPSRTPTTARSVCGGMIISAPKLCGVEVIPDPVPLFGLYTIGYCLSDREGDVRVACYAIRTSPDIPTPTCETVTTSGGLINGCFASGAIRSTNPAGNYTLLFYFEDRAGNRSNVVETAFRIAP